MDFLNPIFIVLGPCGLIFVIVGWIMYKYPPREINGLYGYRTFNSMRNLERWTFAQIYSARLMMILGVIYAILSIPSLFIDLSTTVAMIIGLGILILGCVLLLIRTERAINQRFGKD